MVYVVNMQGLRPTAYEDYDKAFNVFWYLYTNVTNNVSLRRVRWQKVVKNAICRGI